jgi:hypothetical protein
MPKGAGSCSPQELHMLLNRTALIAISISAAAIVALAMISHGLETQDLAEAKSSRVTVINKNQMHPSIDEIEARAVQTEHKGEANSDKGFALKRQDQWI